MAEWCVRDNDGRKLDHKTLEALRYGAIEAVGNGEHPEPGAEPLHRDHHGVDTRD